MARPRYEDRDRVRTLQRHVRWTREEWEWIQAQAGAAGLTAAAWIRRRVLRGRRRQRS